MKPLFYISILLISLLSSCEEVIEVELPNPEGKLVIEGEINSGLPAIVNLSHNMAYFDPIDSASLSNIYITDSNAVIVVSDDTDKDTLSLMPITKFPYIAYVGNRVIGQIGKTYKLSVEYEGKSYYASTTIPETAAFSSIWFEPKLMEDSLGFISFSLYDEASTNNYYAVSSLVLGEQWWYYQPIFGLPVFDDILFNGDSTIVTLPRSYAGNSFTSIYPDTEEGWDSLYYFRKGESISIRLSTIDQEFYLWWNSLFRSSFTGSNPYSNPSSIISNIEGDPALGVWGGYANTIANVRIAEDGKIEKLEFDELLPELLPDSIMNLLDEFIENTSQE